MIEWLAVVVALLALAAAGWAAVEARRAKQAGAGRAEQAQQRRDAAAHQERRRRQADEVMAWMSDELGESGGSTSVIEVQNRSGAPVYDLVVLSSGLVYREPRRLRMDNPRLSVHIFPPGHLVYGPHRERSWDPGRRPDECERLRPRTTSTDERVTAFEFTDASGTRWRRDENGVLEEVSPAPR